MHSREVELKFPISVDTVDYYVNRFFNSNLFYTQKNHYFQPSNLTSIRTRQTFYGSKTFEQNDLPGFEELELVIKKGKDPVNGTDRIEYTLPIDFGRFNSDIEQLDNFVTDIFNNKIWAKWARQRWYRGHKPFYYYLDINSGYGPILEIEGPDEESIRQFAEDCFSLTWVLDKVTLTQFTNEYVENWEKYYNGFLDGERTLLESRQQLDINLLEKSLNNYARAK